MLTDLYQLTSIYAIWKKDPKLLNRKCYYNYFFRNNPFNGGYAVLSGVDAVLDWVDGAHFDDSDIDYLKSIKGNDGYPIFKDVEFFEMLKNYKFSSNIYGPHEGSIVFANEPIISVCGPIVDCMLIETPMLCAMNSQTLIATKASRVCRAAGNDPVMEFGLRRAQGFDGALMASRAAHVGGCSATSNVLAGKVYGIPVVGTHPHGFVMFFDSEQQAFDVFANAMPNNSVFLIDTYNTEKGIENAIEVAAKHNIPVAVRLDSGDLCELSNMVANKINAALSSGKIKSLATKIVASNDLDEHLITSLKHQGSKITNWGVGTKLVTAYDQPALGGVFKMTAIRSEDDTTWIPKIKVSENAAKTTIPGFIDTFRFENEYGDYIGDIVGDESNDYLGGQVVGISQFESTNIRSFDGKYGKNLQVELVYKGKVIERAKYTNEDPTYIRNYSKIEQDRFSPTIFRFQNPETYFVGFEESLYKKRLDMVIEAKGIKRNTQ